MIRPWRTLSHPLDYLRLHAEVVTSERARFEKRAIMSIYHEGFAIPKEDEIPFLQRIFRGPLGIGLLTAFFLISFSYVGTHLGPLLLLFVLRINPLWYRRFVDWGIGLFLTLTMVSSACLLTLPDSEWG